MQREETGEKKDQERGKGERGFAVRMAMDQIHCSATRRRERGEKSECECGQKETEPSQLLHQPFIWHGWWIGSASAPAPARSRRSSTSSSHVTKRLQVDRCKCSPVSAIARRTILLPPPPPFRRADSHRLVCTTACSTHAASYCTQRHVQREQTVVSVCVCVVCGAGR